MRHYIPQSNRALPTIITVFPIIFLSFLCSAQSVVELIDRSDLAIAEGAYIEALGTLSEVLEKDENNSKAHNLRGVCFEKLEQFGNAVDCYRRAIKSDEGYAAPYYNLGLLYMNDGKEKDAIGLFDKYILLKPKDASGWTQKGITYLYTNKLDSALFFLNRAIDLNPKADRALLYRGYTYSMMNHYELAISDLDRAVESNPTSYNYFVRADLKMESDDVKGAIEDYSSALEEDASLVGARLSRANAYLFDEQYDACLKDCRNCIEGRTSK